MRGYYIYIYTLGEAGVVYTSKCTSSRVFFPTRPYTIVLMLYPSLHIARSINSPLINFGLAMILSPGVGDIGFLYVTKPKALKYIS